MAIKNDIIDIPSIDMYRYSSRKVAIEGEKRKEKRSERHKKEKEKNEL